MAARDKSESWKRHFARFLVDLRSRFDLGKGEYPIYANRVINGSVEPYTYTHELLLEDMTVLGSLVSSVLHSSESNQRTGGKGISETDYRPVAARLHDLSIQMGLEPEVGFHAAELVRGLAGDYGLTQVLDDLSTLSTHFRAILFHLAPLSENGSSWCGETLVPDQENAWRYARLLGIRTQRLEDENAALRAQLDEREGADFADLLLKSREFSKRIETGQAALGSIPDYDSDDPDDPDVGRGGGRRGSR